MKPIRQMFRDFRAMSVKDKIKAMLSIVVLVLMLPAISLVVTLEWLGLDW